MFSVATPSPTLPPLNGASSSIRAIVATLLYYDLFSFPLRGEELVRYAHQGGVNGSYHLDDLPLTAPWWESEDGFWFLRGRSDLLARRAALQHASIAKLTRARVWARFLQVIPGVRFVGVTGSLAMSAAVPEDDIDFLIIAAKDRLWLTRALVLAALLALGVKRADDGRSEHPDRICANIFLSEADLHLPDHNLFIAHEVCQMLPLVGPDTYARFLQANSWVRDFLPQWQPEAVEWQDVQALRRIQRAAEWSLAPVGDRLDQSLRERQLARIRAKHSRGHNTNVKITATQLRFHARDLSDYIVETYNARWRILNQSA